MIKFIKNIGDFFSSNYFDEDFVKKVHDKSGYSSDDQKSLQKQITPLKDKYYKFKQLIIEGRLRTKDKILETHEFHTLLLNALGYDGKINQYNDPFHFTEKEVLPIRHKLYRGSQLHLIIMEMQPLIKEGDEEPEGLFEQRYNVEDEEHSVKQQRYHRSQWSRVFQIDEELKISPVIINQAISQLALLEQKERPSYILLLAGNILFLVEVEKWLKGSYLQLDLEELFTEGTIERKYYSLFYLLLCKEMLAPDSDMVLMDQLEEDSHKSAYEVTKDLKEGIIHAVESLANEALYYKKEILKQDFDETDDTFEQQVKDDCLSIVYRLLFIFYAESRPDLEILPISDSVYQKGYSLEMLRDLEQAQLVTDHSRNGYFFHESLHKLFFLLSSGYRESENGSNKSFRIRHIDSPLFDDSKLHQLKNDKFRNFVWQDVICQLSLSKKHKKKARGRISYANLGINQLGSVYESLLAYRGFYAEEDYIEVHPKNKPQEGTLLVQRRRRDDFEESEVLKDDQDKEVVIPKGKFVYRLSGRDRQKSASYYTPEVLTQCTVKYTIKSILEKVEVGELKAQELLELKLLEPAMGAAAFHNELINQLADAYLSYRQKELGTKISPEKYREELQKVKAYIATNNTYGVDLNPTAIELGKLSLWLNVIHKDMDTPFFGYRLGVGNAVVGAWFKVFKKQDVIVEYPKEGTTKARSTPISKEWWNLAPKHLAFRPNDFIKRKEDEIYHFLLPDKGMVPSGGIRLLKDDYPDEAKRVSDWRKEFCSPIATFEYQRLQRISSAIDLLIEEHYKIQASINAQTVSIANVFGLEESRQVVIQNYEEKENLAAKRNNANAPYYKLKMIMDYWCSLWFWDMRDAVELPTRQQWYDDIEKIINIDLNLLDDDEDDDDPDFLPTVDGVQARLFEEPSRQYHLKSYRKDGSVSIRKLGSALKAEPDSLFKNKRSEIVNKLADQYKFFHNQLEFIEVFKERGGFDVIVGNPPWLKLTFEEKGLISESFPELMIRKITAPKVKKFRDVFFNKSNGFESYINEYIGTESSSKFLNGFQNYGLLKGQQTDIYKCVLVNSILVTNKLGFCGLVHPESIYDDSKGDLLREYLYKRLEYHFHFKNILKLFQEVHHRLDYSINIYSGELGRIKFSSINNLLHPSQIRTFETNNTPIDNSLTIKDREGKWSWNMKGNNERIIKYDQSKLKILWSLFQGEGNFKATKLINLQSEELYSVLYKLSAQKDRLLDFNCDFSECYHETNSIVDQSIKSGISENDFGTAEIILSGPMISVSYPIFKMPVSNCSDSSHYDFIDLKNFHYPKFIRTIYQSNKYNNHSFGYKIGFRKMVDVDGERTLQPSLLAPSMNHVNSIISLHHKEEKFLIKVLGLMSSVVYDFFIKTIGSPNLQGSRLNPLPVNVPKNYLNKLSLRVLRLNCINKLYDGIWRNLFTPEFLDDKWSVDRKGLEKINDVTLDWTEKCSLKNMLSRRQALVEIDVLVAMMYDLTLSELIQLYSIVFSISKKFEDDTWYDINGNIVFTPSGKTFKGIGVERFVWNEIKDLKAGETYEHTIEKSELYYGKKVIYHAPFDKCDRVEDYKTAWAHFEEVFKNLEA